MLLLAVAALTLATPGPVQGQFQPFQPFQPFQSFQAPQPLLFFVQEIQNRLQQAQRRAIDGAPQGGVQLTEVQVQPAQELFLNPQPQQQPPQQQPPQQQQRQQFEQQQPQQPQDIQDLQPRQQQPRQQQPPRRGESQFQDPGVGRWVLSNDQTCLPCICEAASGCNETLACDERGFCGPFLLSKRYWDLGGRPLLRGDKPDRPGASEDCLRDSFCAAEAVRGYLDRFAQDCNGDRRVDCLDLARVHFLGPFNCQAPLRPPGDFSDTFLRCWNKSRQAGQGGQGKR